MCPRPVHRTLQRSRSDTWLTIVLRASNSFRVSGVRSSTTRVLCLGRDELTPPEERRCPRRSEGRTPLHSPLLTVPYPLRHPTWHVHVSVCPCACVHTCLWARTYVSLCTCVCVRVPMCTHVFLRPYVYVHVPVHTRVCARTCVSVCLCTRVSVSVPVCPCVRPCVCVHTRVSVSVRVSV